MPDHLFNTQHETATRILLGLPQIGRPVNLDEISAMDLAATYMKTFGFADSNLHGDTPFAAAELTARRNRVRLGLELLVVRGLATSADGTTFASTDKGIQYATELVGTYAQQYRDAISKLAKMSPAMITKRIQKAGQI